MHRFLLKALANLQSFLMRRVVLGALLLGFLGSGTEVVGQASPEVAGARIRLNNLAPLPRTTWVSVVVPGYTAFNSFEAGGRSNLAVKGERIGSGTVYRVRSHLEAGEVLDGVLSSRGTPQPFHFHPWVIDNVAALIPSVATIEGSFVAVSALTELNLVSASPAHQRYHLRATLNSGFILEMWMEFLSGDPVVNLWGALIWSDRNDARADKSIDVIHIESGEFIALDFTSQNGFRLPVRRGSAWRITLPGPIGMIDGSGIPFRGRMLTTPEGRPINPRDPDAQDLLAALHAPAYGVAIEAWDGNWLGHQNVPRLSVASTSSSASSIASVTSEGSIGHIYDDRLLGIGKMPGQTGDQEDFGATKGTVAVVFANPGYIHVAAHSIEQDFFRGFLHYENGKVLDIGAHPRWVTWSGSTHWNSNVSPDRLGKDGGLGTGRSTGWFGYDDQHRSQNNLAAYYQLTGDPLARLLIEHAINTDRAMIPNRIGAPRAVGRLLLCWANFASLGSKAAKVLMADKVAAVAANWPGKDAKGTVKILGWGVDARQNVTDANGNDLPAWSAWEHGLAAVGLYAAYKQGACDKALVLDVCRTIVKHAVFREAGEWVWASNIYYPLEPDRIGLPIPAELYKRGSTFINESDHFGGVATWTFPAFLIFQELADISDPDLPRCRDVVRSITGGNEAMDVRAAEWWSAVQSVTR